MVGCFRGPPVLVERAGPMVYGLVNEFVLTLNVPLVTMVGDGVVVVGTGETKFLHRLNTRSNWL